MNDIKKIKGFKFLINNQIKTFAVNFNNRYIDINQRFYDKLNEQELEFTVRWSKKYTLHKSIIDADKLTIEWFVNKNGVEVFNKFLFKIKVFSPNVYERLCYNYLGALSEPSFIVKSKFKKICQKIKNFLIKKR